MKKWSKELRSLVMGIVVGVIFCTSFAFGYARLNAWHDFGGNFQLGYVVGYFDGVSLAKRHDQRSFMSRLRIPFERWRDAVNEHYRDKSHLRDELPTAMYEVYLNFLAEQYPEMAEKLRKIRPWRHTSPPPPVKSGKGEKVHPSPTPDGN